MTDPLLCRLGLHRLPHYTFEAMTRMTDAELDAPTRCLGCGTEPDRPEWWSEGGSLYANRVQWWAPWRTCRPWLPQVLRGGDEHCNPSIRFVVPLLGCLVVFYRRGPLRTEQCDECKAEEAEDRRSVREREGVTVGIDQVLADLGLDETPQEGK